MATTPYLNVNEFKALTVAPARYVDQIESLEAGWTLGQLIYWSAWMNARLSKRYAAPFASPYPETITGWLADVVTWQVYLKNGVDPTDAQSALIKDRADKARDEIKEAANSESGLFELPLRADNTAGAVSKGAPLGHSEASPYAWLDRQLDDIEAGL